MFDGLDYTREAIAEELSLIERHARDGSAVNAGCACIEEKHLLTLAGLSSEGVTLAKDSAEKQYYMNLAEWARETRKDIIYGNFKKSGHVIACKSELADCIIKTGDVVECKKKIKC